MAKVFCHRKVIRGTRCKQSIMTAARLHSETGHTHRAVFGTMTYRESAQWAPGHIRSFFDAIKQWCKRRGVPLRYVWAQELTKRGRPHYHFIIFLPKALSLPRPDKRGWWRHGMSKIETARCAVAYLAKYASKCVGTAFALPKGARICGAGGLSAAQRDEKSWWMKPRWVRDAFAIEDRPAKITGGYVSRSTGEFLKSPWWMSSRDALWEWCEFSDGPPGQLVVAGC